MERTLVSDEMWDDDPIVYGLRQRLGPNLLNTTGRVESGQLKADAAGTSHSRGFSLKVNRRNGFSGDDGTISIMTLYTNQSVDRISFPSRRFLDGHLPRHRQEIDQYEVLLNRWGAALDSESRFSRNTLRRSEVEHIVLGDLDELARCAQALAGSPRS